MQESESKPKRKYQKKEKSSQVENEVTLLEANDPPQKQSERDDGGLSIPIDQNGLLDWRKVIPTQFIKINSAYAERKNIPLSEMDKDEEKAKAGDENCVITMAGFNYLANIRGYSKLKYKVISSNEDKVSVKCTIHLNSFVANGKFYREQIVEGLASASFDSCTEEFNKYYEALAENRSFIRAVRRAFNINIVGNEEISSQALEPKAKVESILSEEEALMSKSPQEHLELMCEKRGRSLEDLKSFLSRRGWDETSLDFESFSKIPGLLALEAMNLIEASSK